MCIKAVPVVKGKKGGGSRRYIQKVDRQGGAQVMRGSVAGRVVRGMAGAKAQAGGAVRAAHSGAAAMHNVWR